MQNADSDANAHLCLNMLQYKSLFVAADETEADGRTLAFSERQEIAASTDTSLWNRTPTVKPLRAAVLGGAVAYAGNNVTAARAQQWPARVVLWAYYGDGVTFTISNTGTGAALAGTSQRLGVNIGFGVGLSFTFSANPSGTALTFTVGPGVGASIRGVTTNTCVYGVSGC